MVNELFTLVVIGIVLWAVNTYIPMAEPIKKILNVVVVIMVIFWLLNLFGILNRINHV